MKPITRKFSSLIVTFILLIVTSCGINQKHRIQGERGSWNPCIVTHQIKQTSEVPWYSPTGTADLEDAKGDILKLCKEEKGRTESKNPIAKQQKSPLTLKESVETNFWKSMLNIPSERMGFTTEIASDKLKVRDRVFDKQQLDVSIKPTLLKIPSKGQIVRLAHNEIPRKRNDIRRSFVHFGLLVFFAGVIWMLFLAEYVYKIEAALILSLVLLITSFAIDDDNEGISFVVQVIAGISSIVYYFWVLSILVEE